MIPAIRPEDLTTAPQFAARLGLPLHMFHNHHKRGKLVLPTPLMRASEGDRGALIWRTVDVEPYTRKVSWTDEAGTTKVGPYAVLAMQARARGVIVPDSFAALVAAPKPATFGDDVNFGGLQLGATSVPEDEARRPTGDFLQFPDGSGRELQDLNFLNARHDQLGEDYFTPVRWVDETGQDLGVRPLGEHADERRAHYGIGEPNGNALSPSTPAEGK